MGRMQSGEKLTFPSAHLAGIRIGDRVIFDRQPRSVLRHVKGIGDQISCDLGYYIRPSKGFRKHIRRQKAATR